MRLTRRIAVVAVLVCLALPALAWSLGGLGRSEPSIYWGAWIGDQLTGEEAAWDSRAADRFEALAGKEMSLMHFAQPWTDCSSGPCAFLPFPTTPLDEIRGRGAIPVLSWASYALPVRERQPDYQLADIAAGRYDDYIRRFAAAAKAWGHPFFLRFDWEMNLPDRWPYSEYRNGNLPGEFVAMWRHVHEIFGAEGADNVSWVWCPNVEFPGSVKPLDRLYPGEDYVDWTCLDGYNWGTDRRGQGWRSFTEIFGPTYAALTEEIAAGKPVMIGETAASERGGSKADWIEDALSDSLPERFGEIGAFLWFEKRDDGMDWPIETSESSKEAFADGIASEVYAEGEFGDIRASPIPRAAELGG